MKKYVEVEKDGIAREQARMALAQMYQKEGFDIVSGAETNETPEAVSAALAAGSAQIVRGITTPRSPRPTRPSTIFSGNRPSSSSATAGAA